MTPEDRERYSRQIRFAEWGEEGQERLLQARVGIVGCGALGSFQAGVLARAGVGTLVLIDRDYVELSNLQRQWLYDENDAVQALPKAVAAANHLRDINSRCAIKPVVADLTPANIEDSLHECDLILDGTDNFETRYLINDFSVWRRTPWIYGAAVGSYGLSMPVLPGSTACFACVYPSPPAGAQPTCETAGVLGPVTSIIASIQCAGAMRLLTGAAVKARITTVDVWTAAIRQIEMPVPDPDCSVCGQRQFEHLQGRRRVPISLCGRNAVQIHERQRPLDLRTLSGQLAPLGDVRVNEFALRFFPSPYEMTIFPDGRAIVKGTTDIALARSLYARYVGA
jgi:molybdopterin-synthase adenylyltransferase